MHDPSGGPTGRATVRGLLTTDLPAPRVRSLERACGVLAARPLGDVIGELHSVLGGRLGADACRRLHVLVSHLYHQAGAEPALTETLRAGIERARRHC